MVTVYPHEEYCSLIQRLTGESSRAPSHMRQYFERLERKEYLTNFMDFIVAGYGFDG
jgi:choline dehydrogenase